MLASRPKYLGTSFIASLAMHVLFVCAGCWVYSQQAIWLPGYARKLVVSPTELVEAPQTYFSPLMLGDPDGKGQATESAPGQDPMEAPLGPQIQAFTSRDPSGPGKVGDDPSKFTMIPGENGNGDDGARASFGAAAMASPPPLPMFAPPVPPRPPIDDPSEEQNASPSKPVEVAKADRGVGAPPTLPEEAKDVGEASTPREEKKPSEPVTPPVQVASIAEAPPAPVVPMTSSAASVASASASTGGGKPGPQMPAADPAPDTGSESDPFTVTGSAKFRPGKTEVQMGRKYKIVRPRFGLAAQTAALKLTLPIKLSLGLIVDERGNVIHADIVKTSGSSDIDQECKVAAYKFWIEPSKDASGKPIKAVILFGMEFPG
jgi:hypothetical protein